MTNLTDKWKKGELLPEGLYWVKHYGVINILDELEIPLTNVEQILGKVPSYNEYQQLLSDQLAKNEGAEINAELEERLKKTQKLELDLRREKTKLKTENKWYSEQLNEAVKEVGQLKELLKGAKEIIEWYKADCGYKDIPTEVTLQHINQVLGEE